ncbi:alkaline phosphatase PhoX [Actibacterium sp. D379-3]
MKTATSLLALVVATPMLATSAAADLTRLASVPVGAEITGMHLTEEGDFFFNLQHPSTAITGPFNKATVGIVVDADFNGLPEKFEASPTPTAAYDKQTVKTALGQYQVLAQQGDFAETVPGGLGAIIAADGSIMKSSNDPDFNGFIKTGAGEGYLFTNWEDRPGGMSRMKLKKDAGRWLVDAEDVKMLDFTGVRGTWVNCFGSVSPWNTPLTSEELYFDETAQWINPAFEDIKDAEAVEAYLGEYGNPYDYGYIVEITDPTGAAAPVKQMALGRFSHENSFVMPDQKTVYLSDDGTDVVFFKFVADVAADLTAGTLYAGKMTQTAAAGTAAGEAGFDVEWIELAHASNDQINAWVRDYDGKTKADYVEGQTAFISDEDVAAWAEGKAADDRVAFLESRRAAAAKGATAEFRKMEGVMGNHKAMADGTAPYVYMAMSEVAKGMADDKGDIQVGENKCGVVYQMAYDDAYSITNMVPIAAGMGYDKNNAPNACSVDSISNPDNIAVLNDGRVVIGEDTGNHENNMLWLWTSAQM